MATIRSEIRAAPGIERQNTWQKMQEIERQQRVSRLSSQSLFSKRRSVSAEHSRQSSMVQSTQERGRSQVIPSQPIRPSSQSPIVRPDAPSQLSITVPPKSGNQAQIDTSGEQGTTIIVDDAASEVSSICHSPSWTDYKVSIDNEKKKAKARKELERQKKKEEKERLKTEKRADKPKTATASKPKRLSKGPPTTARPGIFGRSATAPAVPVLSEFPNPISLRASTDLSRSKDAQKNSVPCPRKSEETDPSNSRQSLSAEGGFVGGLKLRMLEDASIQDAIAEQKQSQGNSFPVQGSATPRQYIDAQQRALTDQPRQSEHYITDATMSSSMSGNLSDSGRTHESEFATETAPAEYYSSELSRDLPLPRKSYDEMSFVPSIAPEKPVDSYSGSKFQEDIATSATTDDLANFLQTSTAIGDEDYDDYNDDEDGLDTYHSFVTQTYIAPELDLGARRHSALTSRENNATNPMLAGLKKAARSAFSRNSTNSIDTRSILSRPGFSRATFATSVRSFTSNGRTSFSTVNGGNKADRILGEYVKELESPDISERVFSGKGGSMSSASTTGPSSEGRSSTELSTDVTTSNITTPTVSRAHSRQPTLNRLEVDPDLLKPENVESAERRARQASNASLPDERSRSSGEETIALARNKSIGKSQSTSQLQERAADLSFLPELKHQPLTRPLIRSVATDSILTNDKRLQKGKERENALSSHNKSDTNLDLPGGSATSSTYLRDARLSIPKHLPHSKTLHSHPKQMRMSVGTSGRTKSSTSMQDQPIAKMFVICCSCKFFHDLPSKIYEAMAKGASVVQDMDLGVSGVIKTQVSCPWCNHGMSTDCCAGYSTIIYLQERFH